MVGHTVVTMGERFCMITIELSETEVFQLVDSSSGDGLEMADHLVVILEGKTAWLVVRSPGDRGLWSHRVIFGLWAWIGQNASKRDGIDIFQVSKDRGLQVSTDILGRWSWNGRTLSWHWERDYVYIVQVFWVRGLQVSIILLTRCYWKDRPLYVDTGWETASQCWFI